MEKGVSREAESHWRAFISYRRRSDRDRWLAHLLRSRLVSYRTPKRLVAMGVRPRVGEVFLDEEELWSGLGLKESLKEAISKSDHLIVICSPDALPDPKGTDYIQQEIELFRSKPIHNDRILPVISAGDARILKEMNVNEDDDEILAVDLTEWKKWRPLQDRFELLRLAAPLVGCSYAQLRDRERRRARQREVTLGLAAAVFLMTALLALWGWWEANTQKNVANARLEDVLSVGRLVFTVADQELKQVPGAADIRQRLTAAAGEIVEELLTEEQAASDATVLRVRSLGHTAAGDEAWAAGNIDAAIREYQAALHLDETLLNLDPEGVVRYADLSVSHGKLARMAMFAGDLTTVERHASQSKHYAEEALLKEPTAAAQIHALAAAYGQLAKHAVLVSDWGAGRRYLAERMVLATRAARIEPGDPRIVSVPANTYTDMAGLELSAGDPSAASEHARSAIDQFRELRERFPTNPGLLRGLYVSYAALGEANARLGQLEEAISYLARARVLAEDQLAAQPTDMETRTWLGLTEFQIARVEMQAGRPAAAAHSMQRACRLARNSKDPRMHVLRDACAASREPPPVR